MSSSPRQQAREERAMAFLRDCLWIRGDYQDRVGPWLPFLAAKLKRAVDCQRPWSDVTVCEYVDAEGKTRRYTQGLKSCKLDICCICGPRQEFKREREVREFVRQAQGKYGDDLVILFESASIPNHKSLTVMVEDWDAQATNIQLLRAANREMTQRHKGDLRARGVIGWLTRTEVNVTTGVFYRGKKTRQIYKAHRHRLYFCLRSEAAAGKAWDEGVSDLEVSRALYELHEASVAAAVAKGKERFAWAKPLDGDSHGEGGRYVYPPFLEKDELRGGYVVKVLRDQESVGTHIPYFTGSSKSRFDIASEMTRASAKEGAKAQGSKSYSVFELLANEGVELGFRKNAVRMHAAITGRERLRAYEWSELFDGTKKRFNTLFNAPEAAPAEKPKTIARVSLGDYLRRGVAALKGKLDAAEAHARGFDDPDRVWYIRDMQVDVATAKAADAEFKATGRLSDETWETIYGRFGNKAEVCEVVVTASSSPALKRLRETLARFSSAGHG